MHGGPVGWGLMGCCHKLCCRSRSVGLGYAVAKSCHQRETGRRSLSRNVVIVHGVSESGAQWLRRIMTSSVPRKCAIWDRSHSRCVKRTRSSGRITGVCTSDQSLRRSAHSWTRSPACVSDVRGAGWVMISADVPRAGAGARFAGLCQAASCYMPRFAFTAAPCRSRIPRLRRFPRSA